MAILDSSIARAIYESEASDSYDPIPAGEYELSISKTELKDTKNNLGMYIQVEFSVKGPAYQGRKIWENFNIRNASAKAESIGRAQLKSLCLACGIDQQLRDTNDLLNHNVKGIVSIEKSSDPQWPDKNRVKRFSPLTGTLPSGFATGAPMPVNQTVIPTATDFPFGGFAAPTNQPVTQPVMQTVAPSIQPVQTVQPMQSTQTVQQTQPVVQTEADDGLDLPWN